MTKNEKNILDKALNGYYTRNIYELPFSEKSLKKLKQIAFDRRADKKRDIYTTAIFPYKLEELGECLNILQRTNRNMDHYNIGEKMRITKQYSLGEYLKSYDPQVLLEMLERARQKRQLLKSLGSQRDKYVGNRTIIKCLGHFLNNAEGVVIGKRTDKILVEVIKYNKTFKCYLNKEDLKLVSRSA